MSDGVNIRNGVVDLSGLQNFVGLTPADVMADELLIEMLGLTGEETFLVDKGNGFESVKGSYRLKDGDTLEFSRSAGTKG